MNMPLYQLADEFIAIAKALTDQEMPEEVIADTLEGASGELEQKAWNIAALILQLDAEAAMIKEAEQRMSARRKSLEKRVDWLREYLLLNLLRTGIAEISSPEFVVRVRDNPPRVVLDDEEAIPKAFKQKETIISIRKDEIRRALLAGESVKGAHLERDKRLAIR